MRRRCPDCPDFAPPGMRPRHRPIAVAAAEPSLSRRKNREERNPSVQIVQNVEIFDCPGLPGHLSSPDCQGGPIKGRLIWTSGQWFQCPKAKFAIQIPYVFDVALRLRPVLQREDFDDVRKAAEMALSRFRLRFLGSPSSSSGARGGALRTVPQAFKSTALTAALIARRLLGRSACRERSAPG